MTDRPDPASDPWATDPTATERRAVPDAGAGPPPTATPRPATGWGAPPAGPWRRERRDDGRAGSIVFGLILLAVGTWFFLEQTLGFDLPELRWSELWPVILIGIGLWVVLGAVRRER